MSLFSNKLDPGEEVIVVIRKHWIVFALQALLLGAAALMPLVIAFVLPSTAAEALMQLGIQATFLVFLYTLYVLMLWLLMFIAWTNYFLDAWVVTNRRVIDIDQRNLFYRDIITVMLEKIQDATVEVRGLFATVCGFGTLILHTAGDNPDIVIRFASHPQYAKDRIIEAQQSAVHRRDGI